MLSSWPTLALLSVAGVFVPHGIAVSAQSPLIRASSPPFRGWDPCPARCNTAGPDPVNWPVYRTLDDLASCPETLFLGLSFSDRVDDRDASHRIFACSSHGSDWAVNATSAGASPAPATEVNATYELGWWPDDTNAVAADVPVLSAQLRQYFTGGHAATNRTVVLFARFGRTAVGLYIGKGLQNEGTASVALAALENAALSVEVKAPSLAIQLCYPGSDDHIFGFVATTNGTFSAVQDALRS